MSGPVSMAPAWRPWVMNTLAAPPGAQSAATAAPALGAAFQETDEWHLARERALQDARVRGFAAGRDEGFAQGHEEGWRAGHDAGEAAAKAALEAASLEAVTSIRTLAAAFAEALERLDDDVIDALERLALATGRHLAHEAVLAAPQSVIDEVRSLLTQASLAGQATLHLHPDDFAMVERALCPELEAVGWRLAADPALARGGARVSSAVTDIDGSLEGRWATLLAQGRRP